MGLLQKFGLQSRATTLPNGSVPISDDKVAKLFGGLFGTTSAAGVTVNTETALGVPAVWGAVNFIAGTMASLPLHVYRREGSNRKRIKTGIAPILNLATNDETTSFDWRKSMFEHVLTLGRSYTYIERNGRGQVLNLWLLDPTKVLVKSKNGRRSYEFQDAGRNIIYEPSEIIDLAFMIKADGINYRSPIMACKDAIGLAIASTNYGSRFFQNGGVPPFAVTGAFQSGKSMARAADDLDAAIQKATKEDRQALVLPDGLQISSIGTDAEKAQLVELQRLCIEQVARIYSLPPTFLQDLTHGTFSNTEQQDLHFVKHTLRRWVRQSEQQINLKIFGRANTKQFAEFNIDGLLRGDFRTRMEGYSHGVQNGVMTPNEVRQKENLPNDPDGNLLMIQGGTVPIANQKTAGEKDAG